MRVKHIPFAVNHQNREKIGVLKCVTNPLVLLLTALVVSEILMPSVQAQGLTGLFNTGVPDSAVAIGLVPVKEQPKTSNLIVAWLSDSHYQIISAPPGEPSGFATVTATPLPSTPFGSWLDDGVISNWISPHGDQNANPEAPGNYTYQTTFTVSGDPATARISGRMAAADDVAAVLLNGQTVPGLIANSPGAWTGFAISSGFVSGTNTLQFLVQNQHASPMPSGLRVEMKGTTLPVAPANLSATGKEYKVTLNWSPSIGAASYNVYRSTVEGGPYTAVSDAGTVSGSQYTDVNVNSGTTYYYVVTAVNGSGESSYSAEAIAVPADDASGAPLADDAMFVSQSVPSSMTAGQTYNVSVTIQNTGTNTWVAGGIYQLASQNAPGNTIWSPSPDGNSGRSNSISLTGSVATNSQMTFTFTVTAPTMPGTYNFQWQMAKVGSGSYQYLGEQTDDVPITVVPAVPTRLTPAQAVQIAQAYCNSNNNPISVPGNAQYSVPDADDAYWQPRWIVTFNNQATVEVVDATGVVASYTDHAYTTYLMSVRKQPAGPLISQAMALQTAAVALQATSSTEQSGPPTVYLSQDNEGMGAADSTWNVLYNRQFQGIPYKDDFVVITIDAGTNHLTGLSLTYRGVPPDNSGSAMVITQSQAEAIAQAQVNQAGIQAATLQSAATAMEVVSPNTYWLDGGYNFTPGQGKVAWVVNFSIGDPSASASYAVWVDAATGSVIGGEYSGEERGRHAKPVKHAKHRLPSVHKKVAKLSVRKKAHLSLGKKSKRHKATK